MSREQPKKEVITMEYSGPWIVKLTYFKQRGKYYSNGDYLSKKLQMYEIFQEVAEMLKQGNRPGLVDGGTDHFHCLIEVPDHPHNHPFLHIATVKDDD